MAGLELKTTIKEKLSSSFSSIEKGKLEINQFYDSVSSYCRGIIDKKLFKSMAQIETLYGTEDLYSGACKGIMQVNPVVMSRDLITRPHYYGIKIVNGVIDESKSNPNTVMLLRTAMGFSVHGQKISQVTSYFTKNIKDPKVNMSVAALILNAFAIDKSLMSKPLPNLKNYIAMTKKTLKNKGIDVEDAKLNDLIARIETKEQPLEQQYRVLWKYNTGPAYGLKVLYCKLYT